MDRSNYKYFVDVMAEWVTQTGTNIGIDLYYLHGHPQDIALILTEKTKSQEYQYKKYPLICLIQDFEEQIKVNDHFYNIPNCTILIVCETKSEYHAAERYVNSFKPTLYPIYEELISVIENSSETSPTMEDIDYTKIDRVYWGKVGIQGNDGLLFNDKLDAIELRFTNLQIRKNC